MGGLHVFVAALEFSEPESEVCYDFWALVKITRTVSGIERRHSALALSPAAVVTDRRTGTRRPPPPPAARNRSHGRPRALFSTFAPGTLWQRNIARVHAARDKKLA